MKQFALTICVTAGITWASLTSWFPELPYIVQVPFYDKWAHFVMYAALTLAVQWDCRCLVRSNRLSLWQQINAFFLFPALWGILMEVAQACLTTCRTGDPIDALANVVGVLIGVLIGLLARQCN